MTGAAGRVWRSAVFGGLTRLPESSWSTRTGMVVRRAVHRALAARLTGADGRVEAFEPVPASAAAVTANAIANRFDNVRVHEVAVGETAGKQTLHIRDAQSWSHLADRGDHGVISERTTVTVVALDEEIAAGRLPPPDVIKLDVEGSEGAVLRGLVETLRRHRPTIVCELHDTNQEVVDILRSIGYSLENLDGTEPVEIAGPVHLLARDERQPA